MRLSLAGIVLLISGTAWSQAQAPGSVRGQVLDADFDVPLPSVAVTIIETNARVLTSDQGNYVFPEVAPGRYTVVFAKEGYVRQLISDVVVSPGQLTDVDVSMPGEFVEMEEFVVQDVLASGTGSESALLALRLESPSFLDSVSSDLMSRAGASDAAGALRLVAGASIQDGKFAVVRGLPDRYVNSQLNRIRLPTADEEKRAVQLDQFPSAAIESVQVSKTFTPDQQGDASGGAVNIVLRGIPDDTQFRISGQYGYNPTVHNRSDFLSYQGGGVSFWGSDDKGRDPQPTVDPSAFFIPGTSPFAGNWNGAVGTERIDTPIDYKFGMSTGFKRALQDGWTAGAFGSFFYERDAQHIDDGIDDNYWVTTPGAAPEPETSANPTADPFTTELFDFEQSTQTVQWGFLGTAGLENENNSYALTYLTTRIAEDATRLSIDTRGKDYFNDAGLFVNPGDPITPYDPDDVNHPGNSQANLEKAPYQRTESLNYTERTTNTYQLTGSHKLPFSGTWGNSTKFFEPELDWSLAFSDAKFDQPDKRLFGATWLPPSIIPPAPPFFPGGSQPAQWVGLKPDDNLLLGNLQRVFKEIEEQSIQGAINLKFPFERNGLDGYLKAGLFADRVDRDFFQNTYSNLNIGAITGNEFTDYSGDFFDDPPWSDVFPTENTGNPAFAHPIFDGPPFVDVPYEGATDITAAYAMFDMPVNEEVNVIGGVRFERTVIDIDLDPEPNAVWFPEFDELGNPVLNPLVLGDPIQEARAESNFPFTQNDYLPSLAAVWAPNEELTFRAAYSQTVARQTFRELTPILQQEFLGAPIFIGNPELEMSEVKNYDLRFDYAPSSGSLFSFSLFRKDITDPIEFRQRNVAFTFTEPVNYPKGILDGIELEVRQDLGRYLRAADGMNVGVNATFIDGTVTLPGDEIAALGVVGVERTERDMTNAPEYLWNLFWTYDAPTATRIGLFYTIQGDTLIEGGGVSQSFFIPDVYQTSFETLNFSIAQRLGKFVTLTFQAKNITDTEFEEVYRTEGHDDVTRTFFTRGIDYSITLAAEFRL